MYAIHLLIVILLTLQLIKRISKRIPTFLVKYPSVFLVDEVIV